MDLLCGDFYCPKCTNSSSFHHVIDLDSAGITILKYISDIFSEVPTMKNLPSLRNIYDQDKNNIFVIINNNNRDSTDIKNISYEDIQPKFDINKIKCPRCRYRAEKALNLLQNKQNLRIEDIKGICDHCKAQQLSQKPCDICEKTVRIFIEDTNAQKRSDIHRPLSSDRGMKKIHLNIQRPHSKAVKTRTELYKPLLVPPKQKICIRKSLINWRSKDTPKIVEFPSDESIVTSFLTTFSKTCKDIKDKKFDYIFPEKKEETVDSKAVEITSSELVRSTQERISKNIEDKGRIGVDKYDQRTKDTMISDKEKYQETRTKPREMETEIKSVKSTKDHTRPQSSEIKPTKSVKDQTRPRSSEIKPSKGLEYLKEPQLSEIKTINRVKDKKSPDSSETKPTKSVKDQIKPQSVDIKPMKSVKDHTRPQSSEIKPTKSVKDQTRPRSSEIKPSKGLEYLKEPQLSENKPTKSLKEQTRPRSTEIKPRKNLKDQEKLLLSEFKTAKSVKDQKAPQLSETKPTKSVKDQVKLKSEDSKTKKGETKPPLQSTAAKKSIEDKAKLTLNDQVEKGIQKDAKQQSQGVELKKKQKKEDERKLTLQDISKRGAEKPIANGDSEKQGTDKVQAKESKKGEVKPPKQEDKSKQFAKLKQGKGTEVKPAIQEDREKKAVRMGDKKTPPSMIPVKSLLKDSKDTKVVGSKGKSSTKNQQFKKDGRPPVLVEKTKKDVQKKSPKEKDVENVSMKNKAKQARVVEKRPMENKIQSTPPIRQEQQRKQEETKSIKGGKQEDAKKKAETKTTKEELKDIEAVKYNVKDKSNVIQPPQTQIELDVMKFLPLKKEEVPKKVADPMAAIKLVEERMKELEREGLEAARAEFLKRVALPELPKGEYFLFRIQRANVPVLEERRRRVRDLHLSTVEMKNMRIRGPSYDDLVLKMVQLGKETIKKAKKETGKIKRQPKGKYKIRSTKKTTSFWSLSIDSSIELSIDRLAHIVTIQQIRHKIKGTTIVKNVPEKDKPKLQPDPILFHKDHELESSIGFDNFEEETQKVPETKKGIVRYTLSDPTFIEKGWTVLPTMKVVRKMNVYNVRPAYPDFDWFKYHKNKGSLKYESGEKLADFDDNGRGRWFYKNGRIALDYYDSEDVHAKQRFVIYSSGEEDEQCRTVTTILGIFDYLGNGVVFDHNGKIRVKYNQSEGVVLDSAIGPKSLWKWHTLNDPPVLKQVMINTFTESPDPEIQKFEDDIKKIGKADEAMIAIEIENVFKEKAKMQQLKYTPCQIKTKALKINKQFSLKILDQAHVYLYFRDGTANMKLNLGMVLDHQDIIDTDTSDVGDIPNLLEKNPPETDSLVDLQHKIEKIRRCVRERSEHAMKVRPILPVSSADRLVRALSKPLRPPVSVALPDDGSCCHRKPSTTNLYYNTRLI